MGASVSGAAERQVLAALRAFGAAVAEKARLSTHGEPEDQLRSPFEQFMQQVGSVLAKRVVTKGETKLAGRLGKPDFAVHTEGLLTGYAELKAPGTGAVPRHYSGHDREQWSRFSLLPNILYCDGNEWGLYRDGRSVRRVVRLSGDVVIQGQAAADAEDARRLTRVLVDFLLWKPVVPRRVKDLAVLLAPLCRLLRDDVREALN
jgi:hypothetical protein